MTETRRSLEAFPLSPESQAEVATLERPNQETVAALLDQMDPALRRALTRAAAEQENSGVGVSAESGEAEVGMQ